ncbi:UTP--glucose-1-phosphate uridylyltransferase GalU [Zavarzinia sp. CC-PAN008]|uniref:UTP--glucose-1-phosphate uridylyltransferase GalU n=1 Tax=Zavarzinia sp. CC-PAN008 TaxID=3243332 RepID=UPI003F74227D
MKVRKAVFPVAGLGTRSLPATKAIPKEMLPVVDKPLIQYAVEEAKAAGCEQFIFVTGRGKTALEDHFDHAYELEATLERRGKTRELEALKAWLPREGQVVYTRQQEPLGLGHAVLCARDIVGDEPFAVLLPDDIVLSKTPCLQQLTAAHDRTGGSVVAVMDVPRDQTNRYGILQPGGVDGSLTEILGLVEKPDPAVAPSTLSIIGRYVLSAEIWPFLEERKKGAGGEIQLTDAMARLVGRVPFHGLRFEGRRFDCGERLGFLEANVAFGLSRADTGGPLAGIIQNLLPKAAQ